MAYSMRYNYQHHREEPRLNALDCNLPLNFCYSGTSNNLRHIIEGVEDYSRSGLRLRLREYIEPAALLSGTHNTANNVSLSFRVVYCVIDVKKPDTYICGLKVIEPEVDLTKLIEKNTKKVQSV